MSLSVCLLTREPAGRVAAQLEPLRALADEIVLAIDDRVGETALAAYDGLADHLFGVEFLLYERHLAWLHQQCSCEWIMRLDGDEVVSGALLRRLAELLRRRDIQQLMVRRAWVYGDGDTELSSPPWSQNYTPRLVRNDASLRFSGEHPHAEPVFPQAYVTQPVYHLDLVLHDQGTRRAKAIRYEAIRPLLPMAGPLRFNEAFYVPESREALLTRAIPTEDMPAIRQSLLPVDSPGLASDPPQKLRHATLKEMDAAWVGRAVEARDCVATVRPLDGSLALARDEVREIFCEVTNEGGERWPGGSDHGPLIRVAYRWLRCDGAVHTPDGLRTAFPGPVPPGTTAVVPVKVAAPSEPGEFLLEVDLVHEFVRWFGVGVRMKVTVEDRRLDPRPIRRLSPTPERERGSDALLIPRVIHRIWLGGGPMPTEMQTWGATFGPHHPEWEIRLWGEEDLAALEITEAERERARTTAELSDLVRYEILSREGGVYVDTDVECRRPLDGLLRGIDACAALEMPGRVGTAVLAAVPGHAVFVQAAAEARKTLGLGPDSASATGPYLLTLLVEDQPDFTILGAEVFYPFGWEEPEPEDKSFPDAYLVHHWTRTWWDRE